MRFLLRWALATFLPAGSVGMHRVAKLPATPFMAPSSTLTPQVPQAPRTVRARFIDIQSYAATLEHNGPFVAVVCVQATLELVAHPTESMRDASIPAACSSLSALYGVLLIFLFGCWLLYNKSWLRKRFAFVDWAISIGLPEAYCSFCCSGSCCFGCRAACGPFSGWLCACRGVFD